MPAPIRFPDVHVPLTGEDGNSFSIIARVGKALKKAGLRDEADAWYNDAALSPSYEALLDLVVRTVSTS